MVKTEKTKKKERDNINFPIDWESSPTSRYTSRTKVIGGWLVGSEGMGGIAFVPDPDHKWNWE